MLVYVVVHDHENQIFTFSVNAVSQMHGIKKAEKHCMRSNIWKKRIQTFSRSSLPNHYVWYPFPNKKIEYRVR